MPPKIIYDLAKVDRQRVEYDIEEIRKVNPHRFEFEQLTAIHHMLPEERMVIGSRDISPDEFWVRGHVPGNPLFPGVLMIESAAQLCSFFHMRYFETDDFFAFGGISDAKFRRSVRPGESLLLLCKGLLMRRSRSVFYCQGVVDETVAFEAEVTGLCAARR